MLPRRSESRTSGRLITVADVKKEDADMFGFSVWCIDASHMNVKEQNRERAQLRRTWTSPVHISFPSCLLPAAHLTLSLNCCMFLQTTDGSKLHYVAALRLFMFYFCVFEVRLGLGTKKKKKNLLVTVRIVFWLTSFCRHKDCWRFSRKYQVLLPLMSQPLIKHIQRFLRLYMLKRRLLAAVWSRSWSRADMLRTKLNLGLQKHTATCNFSMQLDESQ